MKSFRSVALVLSLSALVASSAPSAPPSTGPGQDGSPPSPVQSQVARAAEMASAAQAWLGSLSPELRAKAQLPFDGEARRDWGYVPRERSGVALGELSVEQRLLFDALLRTGLSQQGYLKAHGVILLEDVLDRDPGLYFATVFGFPDGDEPWSWRFEGHHVSLNFTVQNKKFVTATPLFFGADPAEVRSGIHAGLELFYEEEARVRELVDGFKGSLARDGRRNEDPPQDVVLGPGKDGLFEKIEGIPVSALGTQGGGQMMLALGLFTGHLHQGLGLPILNRYRFRDFNDIGFLYIGRDEPGAGFYFRFSSKKKEFALEYLNRGNHVHWVLRDAAEDFGDRAIATWNK